MGFHLKIVIGEVNVGDMEKVLEVKQNSFDSATNVCILKAAMKYVFLANTKIVCSYVGYWWSVLVDVRNYKGDRFYQFVVVM